MLLVNYMISFRKVLIRLGTLETWCDACYSLARISFNWLTPPSSPHPFTLSFVREGSDEPRTSRTMVRYILSDLPEAISRVVLVEWVRFDDVVRLESALCNRELRKQFHTLVHDRSIRWRST
jgi:hypothetical protein